MEAKDIKPGMMVRHKAGKLYVINGISARHGAPVEIAWTYGNDPANHNNRVPGERVEATQWQVNEKYPEGRLYQASRALKLTDITPA